jgi:hypothetical protein
MKNLEIIKEKLNEVRNDFNLLVKENGEKMYEGIFEKIDELEKYDWEEEINDILNSIEEDEDEDYINCMLIDMVDRVLMSEFGKKLFNNLKELGYKYDGEGWNIKDKYGKEVTCYGFVWDYWYDLDTCVRESVSCIFEEFCEE